jgi:hypothetical protein
MDFAIELIDGTNTDMSSQLLTGRYPAFTRS